VHLQVLSAIDPINRNYAVPFEDYKNNLIDRCVAQKEGEILALEE